MAMANSGGIRSNSSNVSDTAAGVIAAGNSGDGLNSIVKCH